MKKLYKSTLLQLMFALCIFSFAACQEYDIDSQPNAPLKLEVDAMEAYTVLAVSPNDITFNVSSNTPWTITSNKQWCKVNPAMSSASSLVATITVSFEDNANDPGRTAQLTIKGEGVEGNKVITFTQPSKEDLHIIKYDGLVASEGEVITFDIISNKPWKILPSTQFLATVDKMSGNGREDGVPEKISITVPANTGIKRSGEITVKTDFQEETFTITQNGIVIEPAEPTETGVIALSGVAKEEIIKIKANIAWKATVPEAYKDWLEVEAISKDELKITTLKEVNNFAIRKGQILLTSQEFIAGFEGTTLDVEQSIQYVLPNDTYTINTDGSIRVEGKNNNNLKSNYSFKKGHITINFSELNLTKDNSHIQVILNTGGVGTDDSNINCNIAKLATNGAGGKGPLFKSGGTPTFNHLVWEPILNYTFASLEDLNKVRTLDINIKDHPSKPGQIQILMSIVNSAGVTIATKTLGDAAVQKEGEIPLVLSINFATANEGDYYIMKSIDFVPCK